jgi:pyridoxal phosphate enzyme (YggS family)
MSIAEKILFFNEKCQKGGAKLVAVSKTFGENEILQAYQAGQRIFGENRVQELCPKYEALPKDIEWHLIGHLQSNKVKFIAPFVAMIHSVDSFKLLEEIDKQAAKFGRIIPCLLQMHIAQEETKFGFDEAELWDLLVSQEIHRLKNIRIDGLMGMASNTQDKRQADKEFAFIQSFFEKLRQKFNNKNINFCELSIGMSSDADIALQHGSTFVRIGSAIFGGR